MKGYMVMKIIDAFWEKRNLGVSAAEAEAEPSDTVKTFLSALERIDACYQVVKIPAGMMELMWAAEDQGFRYIETSVHVTHDLKNINLPSLMERLDKSIQYEPILDAEMENMFENIRKGMFCTDRVSLDPHFEGGQAADRYIGWIKDELGRGSELFKYIYRGMSVGFFALKQVEAGVYYPFLAGIYPEYQKNVFGAVYLYKPLLEAKKRNGRMVSTYISTNNSSAVRMHVQCGFQFREITYVYVRHKQ